MSRHQRPSGSSNTRSRIVLGSAMTAVFLSGGAGVALADTQSGTGNVDANATGKAQRGAPGVVDGLVKNVGQVAGANSILNGVLSDNEINILSPGHGHKHPEKKREGHKKWEDRDRDGVCDEDEDAPKKWHDSDEDDDDQADEDEAEDAKDDEKKDDEKADEAKDEKKDEKADDKKDEVEAAKSDESTPKVESVATETTESGAVPEGSANTGDGSFVGGVAPVASSWSMADTMFAAGGGVAAAALLAGAGVGVGRHRRAGHRASN